MSTPQVREPAGQDSAEDEEIDEEVEEVEEMAVDELNTMTHDTPSPKKRASNKLSKLFQIPKKLFQKGRLSDQQLARLSNYAEYCMVGFITLAVLAFIAASVHFMFVGFAVPVLMMYVRIIIGSVFAAIGTLALQIILDGGTDYLATVNRR